MDTITQTNTLYHGYSNPNLIPDYLDDLEIDPRTFPKFCSSIFNNVSINYEGKEKFMNKFLVAYLQDAEFRNSVDGWVFLFIRGFYCGVYPTDNDALREAHKYECKGSEIYLIPMYPFRCGEYTENVAVSIGKVLKVLDKLNIERTSVVYDYIKVDGGIAHPGLNSAKEFNVEKFIVDTGAKLTNAPNTQYFDYAINEYAEFPFDENNNLMEEEAYRQDNLLYTNTLIMHFRLVELEGSIKNSYYKNELFLEKGTTFNINGTLNVPFTSMTVPYVDPKIFDFLSSTITNKMGFLLKFKKRMNFRRPENPTPLMGLNTILEMEVDIRKIYPRVSSFLMKEIPTIEETNDMFDNINTFQMCLFKIGFPLFGIKPAYEFVNGEFVKSTLTHTIHKFGLIEEYCQYDDVANTHCHEVYSTTTTINLINLVTIVDKEKLQDKIKLNPNIDGYISRNSSEPHCIEIWLKNVASLNFLRTITYDIAYNNISPAYYYNHYSETEFINMTKYKIATYVFDINNI